MPQHLLLQTCLIVLFSSLTATAADYFAIHVVDEQTGRGVPLVELTTVNGVQLVTDSAGLAAFAEPGLMHREVYFHIKSHGYEFPADGFGFRGTKLQTTPGETARISVRRVNLAERLYRVTGAGIYRDSILLDRPVPLQQPVLNAGVLGSDSVLCAPFRGKLYWFWGDTNLLNYPLGLYHTPGATSPSLQSGELDPSTGINLTYFQSEQGHAISTAEIPGEGPTWLSGLTVLKDSDGQERMLAGYAKIKAPMTVYERGIVEFNPTSNRFERRTTFAASDRVFPSGPSIQVSEAGKQYIYFARPFPDVRVPAKLADFLNPASYECYTCLLPAADAEQGVVERKNQTPVYSWRSQGILRDWQLEQRLLESGALQEDELHFRLNDVETGKRVIAHSGSITWSDYRQRFSMIALEVMGTSVLGEVWYAEARSLAGPWSLARKIVTHDRYSFYNPIQHPEFAEEGGKRIYFEGTYTHTFSGNDVATPRYDYNQIMYRLDLQSETLHLSK